jgi:hypothetical protein
MIFSSSSIVFPLLFVGLMLTSEFTSLDEPVEVFELASIAVYPADGPKFIGFERRTELRDPTQKLKLLIVRSIS